MRIRKQASDAQLQRSRRIRVAEQKRARKQETSAATAVQAGIRGMLTRKSLAETRSEEALQRFQLSARGFLAGSVAVSNVIDAIHDVLLCDPRRDSLSAGAVAVMLDELAGRLADGRPPGPPQGRKS